MVRKEIYQRIVEQLRTALGGEIKHIDLWNHNVEFIEQEQQWSRPAVFVEFGAINWQRLGGQPNAMRGEGTVSLHIVTDWVGSTTLEEDTDDFAAFELSERICSVVRGLRGDHFHGMELITTHTNHNHEELLENIEQFRFIGEKKSNNP